MRRIHYLLIIPLLLTGLYIIPQAVPYAHSAFVGQVCITKNGNTNCPSAPPLLNSSTTLPAKIRVAIVINASSGLDGFDITVLANHNFLKPTGIDLTGSVLLGTPPIFVECVGGVHITGAGSCVSTDTVDTIHLSATSALGSPLTSSPTTGLLFTATYNATGSTYNTPIGFQTGCSNTSVSGGVCVSISNGTPTPDPETVQGATFTDLAYFTLEPAAGFSAPIIPIHTTNQQTFLNLTSINGFQGTVTITVSPPPTGITLAPLTFNVKINNTNPSIQPALNITVANSAASGVYLLNFTATSGVVPPVLLTIVLTVPTPDFSLTTNPTAVKFNVSSTGSSVIRVSSIANFTGTVSLSLGIPAGLNASLTARQLTIPQGSLVTATLKLNSTIYGMYTLNITATSGTLTHTATVSVTTLDFTMQVPLKQLVLVQGTKSPEVIDFTSGPSATLYTVKVNITRIYVQQLTTTGPLGPSVGISVSCSPSSLTITNSSANTEATVQSNCLVNANQPGNYVVTVVAASRAASHAIAFNVQVLGPDFTIVPSKTVQTVTVGGLAKINVTLTRELGLNESITPTVKFVGNQTLTGIAASVNPTKVFLNATSPITSAIITITTIQTTPIDTYFLTVSAFPHAFNITVVVVTTTSPHDLAIYSVTPSTTSTTTGQNITITIVAQNLGSVTETSTVIAIAGDQNIAQQNVTIAPGANATVTLTWVTSGFGTGAYMVGAKILGVNGETNLSNNLLRSATPVTLNAANTSIVNSSYFWPSIIAAIIVIIAIVGFLLLQTRRKPSAPSAPPA